MTEACILQGSFFLTPIVSLEGRDRAKLPQEKCTPYLTYKWASWSEIPTDAETLIALLF